MNKTSSEKIFIVGLDGATFKILLPFIRNRSNSFFGSLMKDGAYANLKVFYPCLSPMEWASFSTGKSPSQLGIFGFYDMRQLDFNTKFFDSNKLGTFFWETLNYYGKSVGVINIPSTYPPKKVNGFIITGLLTPPDKIYYYPREIEPLLRNYKIDFEVNGALGILTKELTKKNEFFNELIDLVRIREETTLSLLKYYKNNIDFLVINFKEIDTVQHAFWEEDDKISKVYEYVDDAVKNIYNFYHPDIVLLMSDHGFHKSAQKYFYLNTWLEKKGYLHRKNKMLSDIKWSIFNKFKNIVKKSQLIRNLIPENFKKYSEKNFTTKDIDLYKSVAFCDRWGIYITAGISKEKIAQLKEELDKITDPETGKKVFNKIYMREELYNGKYYDRFPKIIPMPNIGYKILPHFNDICLEKRYANLHLQGEHDVDTEGVFLAYGKGIRKGIKLDNLIRINDIAPTVLHIFDVAAPKDMDGRVINEIFEENSPYTKRKIVSSSEEISKIKIKIKQLKQKKRL